MTIIVFILLLPFIVVILKAYFEACIQRRLIEPWRSRHFDGDQSDWNMMLKRRDSEKFRSASKTLRTKAHTAWLKKNLWYMGGCQWYSPFWFLKADYLNMARLANGVLELTMFSVAVVVSYVYVRIIGLDSPWAYTFATYTFVPIVKSLAFKFWFYSWLDKSGLSCGLWFRAFVLRKAQFVDGDRVVVRL